MAAKKLEASPSRRSCSTMFGASSCPVWNGRAVYAPRSRSSPTSASSSTSPPGSRTPSATQTQ
eukprot:3975100-Alexandrium_andersonii.AAC.1